MSYYKSTKGKPHMNFTKTAVTALAAIAAFGFVGTATMAGNVGTFEDHEALVTAITRVGVDVYLNPPEVCDRDIDGAYISQVGALVICQDNAKPGDEQADWTDNDLDTLRHEAQHLIQDCVKGERGDKELAPLLGTEDETLQVVTSILPQNQIERIITTYSLGGSDRETIVMELEAFTVAAAVPADVIANEVITQCSAN